MLPVIKYTAAIEHLQMTREAWILQAVKVFIYIDAVAFGKLPLFGSLEEKLTLCFSILLVYALPYEIWYGDS